MASNVVRGRNPAEGYARGWGLQFGGVSAALESDPLYRHAVALTGGRSIQSELKRKNIYLIMSNFMAGLESQDVIEFGSYRGGSAMFMAVIARELFPKATIYALDTFAGMPKTDKTIDAHSQGDFGDVDLHEIRAAASDLKLDNLVFVQGLFTDTLPSLIDSGRRFGLAHIDCDIYDGVAYAQSAIWPHMAPGGYIAYDDAEISSCLGATQAVEELIMERRIHSEQIFPQFVFRSGL